MVFYPMIASSAIRAFISALKLRRCLDFIPAPFPRPRFYTLLTGPNFGEHLTRRSRDRCKRAMTVQKTTPHHCNGICFAPAQGRAVPSQNTCFVNAHSGCCFSISEDDPRRFAHSLRPLNVCHTGQTTMPRGTTSVSKLSLPPSSFGAESLFLPRLVECGTETIT